MIYSNNFSFVQGFCAWDVDIKDTANSKIATFKIHVKERVMKSDKTMKDISHYIECKAWGKTAENIAKHVAKGDFISVLGKTVVDQWEQEGQKRRKQMIEVSDFKNQSKLFRSLNGEGSSAAPSEDVSFAGGMDTTPFANPPAFDGGGVNSPSEDTGGLY